MSLKRIFSLKVRWDPEMDSQEDWDALPKREKQNVRCQACGHRSRSGVGYYELAETGDKFVWCYMCAAVNLAEYEDWAQKLAVE